jgi:hypothetical protein
MHLIDGAGGLVRDYATSVMEAAMNQPERKSACSFEAATYWLVAVGTAAMVLTGCGGSKDTNDPFDALARGTAAACPVVLQVADPVTMQNGSKVPIAITAATFQPAASATSTSDALPEHCEVFGKINERVSSVDGQTYAVKFHLRLPEASKWNGRFFMMGGGGSNGVIGNALGPFGGAARPDNALSRGFAVISTDSGHDNVANGVASRGGNEAFGMDPQARTDYYYNAYDIVTQAGKRIVERYYGSSASKSYFSGCSEGGREGVVLASRFPQHYDGIISGGMAVNSPQVTLNIAATMQYLASEATSQGFLDPQGVPAVQKLFTDPDVQLVADAVLRACDAMDGLSDGIVSKPLACNSVVVHPELEAATCPGAKTDSCLAPPQVRILKKIFAGFANKYGEELAGPLPWDPGIGGMLNGNLSQSWRIWFLGTYDLPSSNSIMFSLVTSQIYMLWETPPIPFDVAQSKQKMLEYDYLNKSPYPAANYPASGIYTDSTGLDQSSIHRTDLKAFKARGGKFLAWHGAADAAAPVSSSLKWFRDMSQDTGDVASFSQYYLVPGMGHCGGGPALDRFDMLTPLMDWVENNVAPAQVIGTASNPGYFGVASRSRPLCPYPKAAIYKGSGDINVPESFTCQ